jgi:hypothetical protein
VEPDDVEGSGPTTCASSNSLTVSAWWNFSPTATQIRPTVDRANLLRRPGMPSASTYSPSQYQRLTQLLGHAGFGNGIPSAATPCTPRLRRSRTPDNGFMK